MKSTTGVRFRPGPAIRSARRGCQRRQREIWPLQGAEDLLADARAVESFTVIGPDLRPVELVDEYLAWPTACERSPNTVEAYAHDLRAFWTFLDEHGLSWDRVGVMELAEFAAWARRPAANVVVLADEAARLSPRTVNRMLTGVVGFYELQARRGNALANSYGGSFVKCGAPDARGGGGHPGRLRGRRA